MKKYLPTRLVILAIMTIPMIAFGDSDLDTAIQPEISVSDVNVSATELIVDYTLTDTEPGSIMTSDEYSPNAVLVDSEGLTLATEELQINTPSSLTMSGLSLDPDLTYTLQFNVPYDPFLTGAPYNEAPYTIYEETITISNVEPTATIYGVNDTPASFITDGTIELHYDLIDDNEILIDGTPRITVLNNLSNELMGFASATVGEDQVATFDGLQNDIMYRVEIIGQYDIDGDGVADNSSPYLLAEHLFAMNNYDYPQEWDQVYGGSESDSFRSVIETSDGGFIAVGSTSSNADGEITNNNSGYPACLGGETSCEDALITKFDSEGNPEWDRLIGGTGRDYFTSVIETSDGGFIAAGVTNSPLTGTLTEGTNGYEDGLLVKFDRNGDKEWDQVYGGRSTDVFNSVIETNDGDYVVAGFSYSDADGEITDENNAAPNCDGSGTTLPCGDGLLVKFNSEGEHVWDQLYGSEDYEAFNSIIENSEGGYTVVGLTQDPTDSTDYFTKGLIVKFDNNGNSLWERIYANNNGFLYLNSIVETSDGDYVAVGAINVSNGWSIKLDKNSDSIWERFYDGFTFTSLIKSDTDDGYLVSGYITPPTTDDQIEDNRNSENDASLVKLDSEGYRVWDQIYGGSQDERFNSVIQTSDGSFVAAGYTDNSDGEITDSNNGSKDGLLVKFPEEL